MALFFGSKTLPISGAGLASLYPARPESTNPGNLYLKKKEYEI